jgi:membrane-bound lytic murein transglycosylase MltF
MIIRLLPVFVGGLIVGVVACGRGTSEPVQPPPAEQQRPSEPPEPAEPPESQLDTELPEFVREDVLKPFTGDLDEMIKRRVIRIGVTFNRTFYFVDKGVQHGVAYEYGRLLEERLNTRLKTGNLKIGVFFVPLPRDLLLPWLVDGKVDLVAAQLTDTIERRRLVDFTNPTRANMNEVVVTGPSGPALASIDDLSGQEVFARETSSYYQNLLKLNERFKAQGKPPVNLRAAPDSLEDDDLLEMVNAGLIPSTVVDDYLATFWNKVFPDLTVHEDVVLTTGTHLAVPIRKNSPQLAAALNTFLGNYGLGSAFADRVERKYLVSTRYVKSAASDAEQKKFLALIDIFRKYSDRYDIDFLLMAAQGYQESMLNQNARSPVGAIGVMQVMPDTGRDMNVGDITTVDPNIHAGIKYMRLTRDAFFKDEPMDEINRGLFTFAAYNAGPGRIQQLRRQAERRGLNPNVWFGNVEQIASERIGRETVTYVSNIYKYYVAYRLVVEERERRAALRATLKAPDSK